MVGRIRWARLGAAVLVAAAVAAPAAPAGADPPIKYQTVVTDDFSSGAIEFVVSPELPELVPPGNYKVGFFNGSVAPHVLVVVQVPDAIDTVEELLPVLVAVEIEGEPPPEGSRFVGAVFSKQGQDHQRQFDLTEPGQYAFFCPIGPPDGGLRHFQEGFVGVFEVG